MLLTVARWAGCHRKAWTFHSKALGPRGLSQSEPPGLWQEVSGWAEPREEAWGTGVLGWWHPPPTSPWGCPPDPTVQVASWVSVSSLSRLVYEPLSRTLRSLQVNWADSR